MKHLAISLVLLLSTLAFAGESVIYSFKSGNDGSQPQNNGLVMDAAGNLYGTTFRGGTSDAGTIYELSPNGVGGWNETVLYSFTATNGTPWGQIVLDGGGNLYGCTYTGGAHNFGSVFELSPVGGSWTFQVLHSFSGNDGKYPFGGIAMDAAGNLYGTTFAGRLKCPEYAQGCGTVFQLSNSAGWPLTTVHSFSGGNDGGNPEGALAVDASRTVYGTTTGGAKYGVVFGVAMGNGKWKEKVIHTFQGGKDGFNPQYGIFLGPGGSLYGAVPSESGGDSVYRLTSNNGNWRKQNVYQFTHNHHGHSEGGLAFDQAGNVYGTTALDADSDGSAFELSPLAGKYFYSFTILHNFQGGSDGEGPTGQLVMDGNGNLYGTTAIGGGGGCSADGCGTMFEIAPSRALGSP